MKKAKKLRATLVSSVLVIAMSFVTMVGGTYAWFTDTVESGRNYIIAGNLDAELEYAHFADYEGESTEWTKVDSTTDDIWDDNALWEPGRTEVVYFKVSNPGTLAFKYQLGLRVYEETPGTNVYGEEFKLSDYLMVGIVDETDLETALATREDAQATATNAFVDSLKLNPNGDTPDSLLAGEAYVCAMVVYFPTETGNEANYKTGTTVPEIQIGVNLVATQFASEEDSYSEDYYDDDATLPPVVDTTKLEGFVAAIESAEGDVTIQLDAGLYNLPAAIKVPENANITVNGADGATIAFGPAIGIASFNGTAASASAYTEGIYGAGNLTFNNITFTNTSKNYAGFAVCVSQNYSGNITFDGCTFKDMYATVYYQPNRTENYNEAHKASTLTVTNSTYVNTLYVTSVDYYTGDPVPVSKTVTLNFAESNTKVGIETQPYEKFDETMFGPFLFE